MSRDDAEADAELWSAVLSGIVSFGLQIGSERARRLRHSVDVDVRGDQCE